MTRRARTTTAAVLALTVAAVAVGTVVTAAPWRDDAASALGDEGAAPGGGIDVAVVLEHLEAFQRIADENGGNRASGMPGFDASVDHVVATLRAAGYEPVLQEFEIPGVADHSELEVLGDAPAPFVPGRDFVGSEYPSASGREATGTVVGVDLLLSPTPQEPSTSGCEEEDFEDFPDGSIALLQRGGCPVVDKIFRAQDAGAAGVVVMTEGEPGRTGVVPLRGDIPRVRVPVVSVTYEVGATLAATASVEVRMVNLTGESTRPCVNVLAELPGRDDRVVMAGAHLDSVLQGPGINDNASGAAALLAVAEQLAGRTLERTVRFAWWGAEEIGLLGSQHYVTTLGSEDRTRLEAYLNVDMLASPNHVIAVHDGNGSGLHVAPLPVPEGSARIEKALAEYLTARGTPFQEEVLAGNSDYAPFMQAGIPVGGLLTGAGETKSEPEADLFGGVAGEMLDPCYHAACDSLVDGAQPEVPYTALREGGQVLRGNISVDALDITTNALAAGIATLASAPGPG